MIIYLCMTDESVDRAYFVESDAIRYADATGLLVDSVEVTEGLESELKLGLSFFTVMMFRDGIPWGSQQSKSTSFNLAGKHFLRGYIRDGEVLEYRCWAIDEADAIAQADRLRLEIISTGEWVGK